jgi:hypothetical protein
VAEPVTQADRLVQRIRALLPTHPELATMTSAWDLFKVPGLETADLELSLAEAETALRKAQGVVRV